MGPFGAEPPHVWIEAESNRIGDVYVPPALWVKMQSAHGIEIQMPIEERVRHLLEDYAKLLTDPETLKEKLRQLTTRHGTRLQDHGRACAIVYTRWSWYSRAANATARIEAIMKQTPAAGCGGSGHTQLRADDDGPSAAVRQGRPTQL